MLVAAAAVVLAAALAAVPGSVCSKIACYLEKYASLPVYVLKSSASEPVLLGEIELKAAKPVERPDTQDEQEKHLQELQTATDR